MSGPGRYVREALARPSSATMHFTAAASLQAAPSRRVRPRLVNLDELLQYNSNSEPVLLRELTSDAERLAVLSEVVAVPMQRQHHELDQIWLTFCARFVNDGGRKNHRSKRGTFLSKIFGRQNYKQQAIGSWAKQSRYLLDVGAINILRLRRAVVVMEGTLPVVELPTYKEDSKALRMSPRSDFEAAVVSFIAQPSLDDIDVGTFSVGLLAQSRTVSFHSRATYTFEVDEASKVYGRFFAFELDLKSKAGSARRGPSDRSSFGDLSTRFQRAFALALAPSPSSLICAAEPLQRYH